MKHCKKMNYDCIDTAKKVAPTNESKTNTEKKDTNKKKTKTIAETDRDKLDEKFSKKKEDKLN